MQKLLAYLPVIEGDDVLRRVKATFDASKLLGLLGTERTSLFQYLVNYKDITEKENQVILHNCEKHYGEFETSVKLLIRLFINGRLVSYPVLGTVMTQQKTKSYFRGENAFYGSSRPSTFRKGNSSEPDWLTGLVNDLRREEGVALLDHFISVIGWPNCSVNHLALAQHYGLKTQMIDITSDINAALFFACCRFENGRWRPLRKAEIEKKESRPQISKLGGDSRFSVIYRQPSEIVDMKWALSKGNKDFRDYQLDELAFPIGYQPFMRCSAQHGYGLITLNTGFDLYQDANFAKYKIRLTEELTTHVFEKMDKGERIYPNKDVPDITEYFERVNKTKVFSRTAFEEILSTRDIPTFEWERIEQELNAYGFRIAPGTILFVTDQEIARINNEYPPECALELLGISPAVDPLIIIDESEEAKADRSLDDEKYKFMMVKRTTHNDDKP